MNKRYSSYRGRRNNRRNNDSGGWKRVCLFGILIGTALMCNVFFREQIQEVREKLQVDRYTEAVSAFGAALSGKKSASEAWDDAVAAMSVTEPTPEEEAVAVISEFRELGSGDAAYDLLENGLYYILPDDAGGYTFDPDDAIMTFDFLELPDSKEVTAYKDGVVVASGSSNVFGNYLIILHDDVTAQYFHCGEILVSSGDSVTQGQIIATQ